MLEVLVHQKRVLKFKKTDKYNFDWVVITESKNISCSKSFINRSWDRPNIDYIHYKASQILSGRFIAIFNLETFKI